MNPKERGAEAAGALVFTFHGQDLMNEGI